MKRNYEPIFLMDTGNLTNDEFSAVRERMGEVVGCPTIGGSAVGYILGHSVDCIPEEYFAIRRGEYKKDEKDDWYLRAGHLLEAPAITMTQWWFDRERPELNAKILEENGMYQHGETNPDGTLLYPWAVANPDVMIKKKKKKGGYEQKTKDCISLSNINAIKAGNPVQANVDQCRFYMAVMNLDFWVLSYWWGTGPSDIKVFFIYRDYDIEKEMMEVCDDFVKHLIMGTKPDFRPVEPTARLRYITQRYGVGDSAKVNADLNPVAAEIEAAYVLDQEISDAEQKLKALKKERDELVVDAADIIGDGVYGTAKLSDGTDVVVELSRSVKRPVVDAERLKAEKPDVYEKYANKLNEKILEEDEPLIYAKYLIEPQISDPKKSKIKITKRK